MKAGELTFEVTNSSHFLVREVFLVPLPGPDGFTSDAASRRPRRRRRGTPGRTALEPGQSLTVSVNLGAGEYALFVNLWASTRT